MTSIDMVIAFCTSCMNRRWQVEQTLSHNLELLRGTPHLLALGDYNSSDGLPDYVRERFRDDCLGGALIYFRTTEPATFDASRAKNLAHRLALRRRPDVLFNLDADNFITAETLGILGEVFSRSAQASLHHWSGVWGDGTFGRIAMAAREWQRLGGYDESLPGMSWQDVDLLFRARASGLEYRCERAGIKPAVLNTLDQKLANLDPECRESRGALESFQRMNIDNMVRTLAQPIALPFAGQRRYPGVLNFASSVVV
jgi:hypothetical protein